jgi:gliding motility-associated-like protein
MNRRLFLIFLFVSYLPLQAQFTIWLEDFSTVPAVPYQNPPRWTTQYFDTDDPAVNAGGNFWGVQGGVFKVKDIEGPAESCDNYWWSEKISIEDYVRVEFSVDIDGYGGLDCGGSGFDEVETSYRVDNGPWQQVCQNGLICGPNGLPAVARQENIYGDSIELRLRLGNKANSEVYTFDNVKLIGYQTVLPLPGVDTVYYRCRNQGAVIFGQLQTQEGTYYHTYTDRLGCDSMAAAALVIRAVKDTLIQDSICSGDSVFLENRYRHISGTYYDTLGTVSGCDSVIITHLTVLSRGGDTLQATICQGDSLLIGSKYYKSSGVYSDTISRAGCDSISFTDLIVYPSYLLNQSFSICAGDSLLVNGRYLKKAGVYRDTLSTLMNCDSIVISTINLLPVYDYIRKDTICDGDSIFLENRYVKQAGVYYDTLQTLAGCDSLVSTQLTVNQAVFGSANWSICQGDSIFLGGKYRKVSGFFNDTLRSLQTGCDSINLVSLSVISRNVSQVRLNFCEGDSVLLNGTYYRQSIRFSDTATGLCGDITNYQLNAFPVASTLLRDTICQGDSILWAGSYRKQSGNYPDTSVTANGCDSIIILDLLVAPSSVSLDTITICKGDSAFIAGSYRKSQGSYSTVWSNRFNCDSSFTTELIVLDKNWTALPARFLCEGQSLTFAGMLINSPGTYYDTLPATSGCDSIVSLNVWKIVPRYDTVPVELCDGDSAYFGNSWHSTAGFYNDTTRSIHGNCDSLIRTYRLRIKAVPVRNIPIFICEGDSVFLAGAYQKLAGTYSDTLSTSAACDSIINTSLIVYQDKQIRQTITICEGDTTLIVGKKRYQAGTYRDTLVSVEGCDSVVVSTLKLQTAPKRYIWRKACLGDTLYAGAIPITRNDTLSRRVSNGTLCDSLIVTYYLFESVSATFSYQQSDLSEPEISFSNESTYPANYWWDFGDSISSSEQHPLHNYQDTGMYMVTLIVENASGCKGSFQLSVQVTESIAPYLFVPTAFTPNNDGVNDFYSVESATSFDFFLQIYNRWGELIFETSDLNFRWDGVFQGELIPEGTYFFVINGKYKRKGSITVVR